MTPSNTWFLGLTWVSPANRISVSLPVFAQLICMPRTPTRTQTDRQTTLRATSVATAGRTLCTTCRGSVMFFSRHRSEGWPHHERTISIYLCPLSFWLTLPRGVLSTYWCCPSRPCVVFLAGVHLALFLALSLSSGNSPVSSWCGQSMLAFYLSNSPVFTPALFNNPLICFLCCPRSLQNLFQSFHLKGVKMRFFILSECPA